MDAGPEVVVLAEVLAARLALVRAQTDLEKTTYFLRTKVCKIQNRLNTLGGGLLADVEAQLADAHLVRTRKGLWERHRRRKKILA